MYKCILLALTLTSANAFNCYQCFTDTLNSTTPSPTPSLSTLQSEYAIYGFPMDKMPPFHSMCDSEQGTVVTDSAFTIQCSTYCMSWYINIPSANVTRFMRGCYETLTGVSQITQGAQKALQATTVNTDPTQDPTCQSATGEKFYDANGNLVSGVEYLQICNKDSSGSKPCNVLLYTDIAKNPGCMLTNPNPNAGTCFECRNDAWNGQCDDNTCGSAGYCTKTWTKITQADGDDDYVTEKGCSNINPHFGDFCTTTGNYQTDVITRSTQTTYNTSSCYCTTDQCNASVGLKISSAVFALVAFFLKLC